MDSGGHLWFAGLRSHHLSMQLDAFFEHLALGMERWDVPTAIDLCVADAGTVPCYRCRGVAVCREPGVSQQRHSELQLLSERGL